MRGCVMLIMLLGMMAMPFVVFGTTLIAFVVLGGVALLIWGLGWAAHWAEDYFTEKAEEREQQGK